MLVLTRRKDESVFIELNGVLVKAIVVDIKEDKVRLGFEAPNEVEINREEVYHAIQRQKKKEERQ